MRGLFSWRRMAGNLDPTLQTLDERLVALHWAATSSIALPEACFSA